MCYNKKDEFRATKAALLFSQFGIGIGIENTSTRCEIAASTSSLKIIQHTNSSGTTLSLFGQRKTE